MAYKIEQSNVSIQDFIGILDYLTETLFSPTAARHFSNALEVCYNRLIDNPIIYPLCRDEILAMKGIRLAPVMSCIVFYAVDTEKRIVRIHRVLHGTMDYTQQEME